MDERVAGGAPRARAAWQRGWVAVAVASLLACGAYARVLDGEFQYDDARVIERDPAVRVFDRSGVTVEGLRGAFAGDRPLTRLTFALNRALGGRSPRGFHAANVALHLATAWILFLLGRRLVRRAGSGEGPGEWIAAAATAIFLLHPIQSGAVAYVTQRAEVLVSLFYAAAVLLLLVSEEVEHAAARWSAYAGSLAALVLALWAKPLAVTMPLAWLAAATLLPPAGGAVRPGGRWRRLALLSPFVLVAVRAGWSTVAGIDGGAGGGQDAGFDVPGLPPWTYFLTELRVLVTYLRLLVFPVGQSVDWDFAPSSSLLSPPTTLAAAGLLGLLAGGLAWGWWRLRHDPSPWGATMRLGAFGAAWFVILLGPTSSFVPLADVLMEHRLYLAAFGPFLTVTAAVAALLQRVGSAWRGRVALGAALLIVPALALGLHARNGVWETRLALWEDARAKAPDRARPLAQVAFALQEAGRVEEAIGAYRASIARFRPTERETEIQVRRNFAALLASAGRADEAVQVLDGALALAPANAELAVNMALARLQLGDLPGAREWVERALARAPGMAEAHGLRGSIGLRGGDPSAALRSFDAAAQLAPDAAGYPYNGGVALERLGRMVDACAKWRTAMGLRGDRLLMERIQRKLLERCR